QSTIKTLLTASGNGGYIAITDPNDPKVQNYYWNPGSSQSYYNAAQFYLPEAFFDPFQYPHIKHGAPPPPATVPRTSYRYDDYHLLVKQVTDPLKNTTRITAIDYQYLVPTQLQDINGNRSEVLFDPLGFVIATSYFGTENGVEVGFGRLNQDQVEAKPTLEEIMTESPKYLKTAASYFYYDLFCWMQKGIPAHFATLVAEAYPSDGQQKGPINKTVTYSDGFGRHLQSKTFLDSTETVRALDDHTQKVMTSTANTCWLTSGAVRYNDKGDPIKEYEPYFSPDYHYVNERTLNEVGYSSTLYYDALDRDVLTLSPEGFLEKTLTGNWGTTPNPGHYQGYLNQTLYGSLPHAFVPSPWSSLHFDADDTVKDSTAYQIYKSTGTSPSQDVDGASLVKAAVFFNTPMISYADSMGREVQSQQQFPPDWREPHDPQETEQTQENINYRQLDILGDALTMSDQRLHPEGIYNFQTSYNLSQEVVKSVSVDGGTNWILYNVIGHLFWSYDSRGTTTTHTFDVVQRPVSVHVHNDGSVDATLMLDQTVEYIVYGDSQNKRGTSYFPATTAAERNLLDKPVIHFDQSGLDLTPFFTLHGHPQATGKILTSTCQQEPRWDIQDLTIASIVTALKNIKAPRDLKELPVASLQIAGLEDTIYANQSQYDALGRVTQETDPDSNLVTSHYYRTGWLKSTATTAGAAAKKAGTTTGISATPGIVSMRYNAKGQQEQIISGNGVITTYRYDVKNFRLLGIRSAKGDKSLQDLSYHHDPVGNVTSVTDYSIPAVFFKNEQVHAKSDYTYDALYRLITATGREHTRMWQNLQAHHNAIKNLKHLPTTVDPVSNGKALQNYTEHYTYDSGGNLTAMRHTAKGTNHNRTMHMAPDSNRLVSSTFSQSSTRYHYDGHGNQQTLEGLWAMQYNYRNNIGKVTITEHQDTEYYVYDANGTRVRKVREIVAPGTTTITEVIYREHS
ncbi:MAG: hypothetical protein ETSY2_45835, partial [Candidatus Entotheonella gemina]